MTIFIENKVEMNRVLNMIETKIVNSVVKSAKKLAPKKTGKMASRNKNKTIQIRVDELDKKRINLLYERIEEFNLSSFVRKSIVNLCKDNDIDIDKGD